MFKPDMFPKRGLGSSDVSLILFLLLAPIFAIYMIVTVILELVGVFSASEDKTENKTRSDKPSPYSKLITTLSNDTRVTKFDYSDIIKSNIDIKQRIEILYSDIDTYKKKARRFGFITKLKKKYIRQIQTAFREIHSLEVFNKIPVLVDKPITEVEGCIYLKINSRFNSGNKIVLDYLSAKKNKAQIPYAINKVPTLSLQFNPIELYFFNDALAITTKDDYIVIDRNSILVEYRTLTVAVFLENENKKLYNIVDTEHKYFNSDMLSFLKYKKYSFVEIGVLELNITTQKINLLFSNVEYGHSIYKSLFNNLTC